MARQLEIKCQACGFRYKPSKWALAHKIVFDEAGETRFACFVCKEYRFKLIVPAFVLSDEDD